MATEVSQNEKDLLRKEEGREKSFYPFQGIELDLVGLTG